MTRAEANDAGSICVLANFYQHGLNGIQQDHVNAIEQYTRAADLGLSKAHCHLGDVYCGGSDLKKAKFHFETAAMAGCMEYSSGNME
jgi:TPR repeat protein